jgi:hypothetical protein
MIRPLRTAAALLVTAGLVPSALAQSPAASPNRQPAHARPYPYVVPYDSRQAEGEAGSRSVLRYHRDPYHQTYGFRNPGGIGRRVEFYPPGDRFQNAGAQPHVARFANGEGPPSRAEQLQAQAIGNQRYGILQGHIDAYGRPFGYGWGWGWGFGSGVR